MKSDELSNVEATVNRLLDEYLLLLQCHQSYVLARFGPSGSKALREMDIPNLMKGLFESGAAVRVLSEVREVIQDLAKGATPNLDPLESMANSISQRSDWFFTETFLKNYLDGSTHPEG